MEVSIYKLSTIYFMVYPHFRNPPCPCPHRCTSCAKTNWAKSCPWNLAAEKGGRVPNPREPMIFFFPIFPSKSHVSKTKTRSVS